MVDYYAGVHHRIPRGFVAIWDIHPKFFLNSNLAKPLSFITSFSIGHSFWKFAQSTAVSLPCSMQNFRTIGQPKNKLWANEISLYLSLRWISAGYHLLRQPQVFVALSAPNMTYSKTLVRPNLSINGRLITHCMYIHGVQCRTCDNKQRVLMHRHQGLNVRHGLCHIYMRYLYIYELFIAFVCFVVCSLL